MPERDDGGVRQEPADHRRDQREVIVVDQHDRVRCLRLLDDGIRKVFEGVTTIGEILSVAKRMD